MKTILAFIAACLLTQALWAQTPGSPLPAPPPSIPLPAPSTNIIVSTNAEALAIQALRQRLATNTAMRLPALPAPRSAAPTLPSPTAAAPAAGAAPPAVAPAAPTPSTPAPPAMALPGTAASAVAEAVPLEAAVEIQFEGVNLDQVLLFYAKQTGRTVIRSPQLAAQNFFLKSQSRLSQAEAIQAVETMLALNQIAIVPLGDKFVTVVPLTMALQQGGAFSDTAVDNLPEAAQYMTQVVQLKHVRPSEIQPILQSFAQVQGGIVPIESSQVLVIRDFAVNVKRMMELIEKVDVEVPMEFTPEVIPIKYALAEDIATVLGSLTAGGGGGVTVGRRTGGGMTGATGMRPGGIGGVGGMSGQPGMLQQPNVGGIPGAPGSSQSGFQNRIQQIISRASSIGDITVLGSTKIIADTRINALLVFATKQDMVVIKDIVNKLDVVLAQVLIEAIIMEVTLGKGFEFGVSAAQRRQQTGDVLHGGLMNNSSGALGGGNNFLEGLATNGMIFPNSGGLTYFAQFNKEWDVALSAIATDSRVNVLSRPRIQTSHAVEASLFIGNTVPYITGTSYSDYNLASSRSTYQEKRVGITLRVLPLINQEGLVVMDISQDIENLGPSTTIDGNQVPTTTQRSASAKVAVRDRDTVILGGFIANQKSKDKSGVPILMDIPLVGWLFRKTTENNNRVELIVLIRPTVLETPEAAAATATIEREKMMGVREAEREEQELNRKAEQQLMKDKLKKSGSSN